MKSLFQKAIPNTETVREISVVVVGILIAFGLDAWWQGVSKDVSLREQSIAVSGELGSTSRILEDIVGVHQHMSRATESLIELIRQAPDQNRVEVPDTMIAKLMTQVTMDVSTSSFEAFLTAGGWELISDIDQREKFRSWPTVIDDARDDQRYLRDTFMIPLADFLRTNYDLKNAELTFMEMMRSRLFGDAESLQSLEYEKILLNNDSSLMNYLVVRQSGEDFLTSSLSQVYSLSQELEQILSELQ